MPHPAMRHRKANVARVLRTSGSFSRSMSSAIADLSSLVAAKNLVRAAQFVQGGALRAF